MSKYIDAEKLLQRLEASPIFYNFGEDGTFIKEFVMELIQRQPTINPDEIRIKAIDDFAVRLKKYYNSFNGSTSTILAAYHINQIAEEMMVLNDEK